MAHGERVAQLRGEISSAGKRERIRDHLYGGDWMRSNGDNCSAADWLQSIPTKSAGATSSSICADDATSPTAVSIATAAATATATAATTTATSANSA